MWLRTNFTGKKHPRCSGPGFFIRGAAACMLILSLAACGYGFGAETATILAPPPGGGLPTIKVKSIENPTLFPWLSYTLRTELRDELAARKVARWVDSGRSEYEIALKVSSFTIRSWLTDSDDATSLYSANMSVEAVVYSGDGNREIWRSGSVDYSHSYESVQEHTVAEDLTREIVRRLVVNLRRAF